MSEHTPGPWYAKYDEKLMAAAPVLLEAAKKLSATIGYVQDGWTPDEQDCLRELRTAIAFAEPAKEKAVEPTAAVMGEEVTP